MSNEQSKLLEAAETANGCGNVAILLAAIVVAVLLALSGIGAEITSEVQQIENRTEENRK